MRPFIRLRGLPGSDSLRAMATFQLPRQCGVMLLPDCTLFPHGGLPLFIFEPRYRRMLEDALAGDCFFAIGRLLDGGENLSPVVAPVGTVGLIRASRQRSDGTSKLLLHGVIRVSFASWLDEREYPFAEIEPVISTFEPEHQADAAMATLRGAVEDAMDSLPEDLRENVLGLLNRAEDPGVMTDLVCQQFIHEPDLRQRLLETTDIAARIPLICDYLREAGDLS